MPVQDSEIDKNAREWRLVVNWRIGVYEGTRNNYIMDVLTPP